MSKKIISLDFWNTIGTPNPKYTQVRNEYLEDVYKITPAMYKDVKHFLDVSAENLGLATTPKHAIALLVHNYAPMNFEVTAEIVYGIEQKFVEFFKEHPPIIIPQVEKTIKFLENSDAVLWGVTSNTNFISGKYINQFLENYFDTKVIGVYSDLFGHSKPSDRIFIEFYRKIQTFYGVFLDYGYVNHIGDSQICDVDGAKNAGFKSHLVKDQAELYGIVRSIVN